MKINRFLEKAEIPPGLINGYSIEIYSGKEAVLSGKIEILNMSETMLKLKINEHTVCFSGKNIKISCYTNDGIKISGIFDNISF